MTVPNPDYSQWAGLYDAGHPYYDNPMFVARVDRCLCRALIHVTHDKSLRQVQVLDPAIGTAYAPLRLLAMAPVQLTGVDRSLEMLEVAQAKMDMARLLGNGVLVNDEMFQYARRLDLQGKFDMLMICNFFCVAGRTVKEVIDTLVPLLTRRSVVYVMHEPLQTTMPEDVALIYRVFRDIDTLIEGAEVQVYDRFIEGQYARVTPEEVKEALAPHGFLVNAETYCVRHHPGLEKLSNFIGTHNAFSAIAFRD